MAGHTLCLLPPKGCDCDGRRFIAVPGILKKQMHGCRC